jgi:signal transduction histidine kinase
MASSDNTIMLCNPMLCSMLHLPEEEIVGKKVQSFLRIPMVDENERIIPSDQLPLAQLFSSTAIKDFIVGVRHPVRKQRSWVMINSNTITDDAGHITHVICMLKDITKHKEVEKRRLEERIQHQRQLTQATIDGQEKERIEIGKELHDNIGQQLTTIKLFLDMMNNGNTNELNDLVQLSLKNIGEVINEVRAMSRSLVPHTLKDLGLVESVQELVDTLSRTQSLDVEFIYTDCNDALIPQNQQLTLFRIVQEQLNNICKHAHATSASIHLQIRNDNILLKISDDGKGFDSKNVKKGLGLANITNRVELFGGKMSLVSEMGYGTLISISMPLASKAASLITKP